MYAEGNPSTKKMLKEWVASGRKVYAFQPGGRFPGKANGKATIKGPHSPQPPRWYARVMLQDYLITKVW